jgi:hypothetical protein
VDIVRTSRDPYDGRIRNPFNEYECGHWYARHFSSYGYIQALTGVRYDAVQKKLYVASKWVISPVFYQPNPVWHRIIESRQSTVRAVYGKIDIDKTEVT